MTMRQTFYATDMRLVRTGGENDPASRVVVSLKTLDGKWIEMISELHDTHFDHTVSANVFAEKAYGVRTRTASA
jgi:hypothetical protein